jgi:hypothetical protein
VDLPVHVGSTRSFRWIGCLGSPKTTRPPGRGTRQAIRGRVDLAGPRCVLLVYVDDATSRLMQLRFVESESTFDYFAATREYIRQHGKPVAFYSDKASTFRVNAKEPRCGPNATQFTRALGELNIDLLCANSPQAKGCASHCTSSVGSRVVSYGAADFPRDLC